MFESESEIRMINLIKKLLKENIEVNDYKITVNNCESIELFYVLDKLETNRATNVVDYEIFIYKDFANFRGSSSFKVNHGSTEEDIKGMINQALYRASFEKNQKYTLPNKEEYIYSQDESINIKDAAIDVVNAIMEAKKHECGWINSTEVFLTKTTNRLINSNDIDYSYTKYTIEVEVVPTWSKDNYEVELYKMINLTTFDTKAITDSINEILDFAKLRSEAIKPDFTINCPVILRDDEVKSMFLSATSALNYANIYNHTQMYKIDDNMFDNDDVTVTLKGVIPNSITSSKFDNDGVILKDLTIIEKGIVKSNHGSYRIGQYIKESNPSGMYNNICVNLGNTSYNELTKTPYLECISFSGIQIDEFSDYIGGEVRLAMYFDGENVIPVTGICVSGSLKDVRKNMILSKEQTSLKNYIGPKYLKINNMNII